MDGNPLSHRLTVSGLEKESWFKKIIKITLKKFFVQASNTRRRQIVQMLCDDVINDKDYVAFKSVTEDRELRKYIRR